MRLFFYPAVTLLPELSAALPAKICRIRVFSPAHLALHASWSSSFLIDYAEECSVIVASTGCQPLLEQHPLDLLVIQPHFNQYAYLLRDALNVLHLCRSQVISGH